MNGATGKDTAISGAVSELQAFALSAKINGMFADNIASADGMDADFFAWSCPDESLATMSKLFVAELVGGLEDFEEAGGGSAGCVLFVMVMQFKHFGFVGL
jgi:hypothetical protein